LPTEKQKESKRKGHKKQEKALEPLTGGREEGEGYLGVLGKKRAQKGLKENLLFRKKTSGQQH